MEDCCAVCAEPLEWIAYGPCGHREVCSTCTARLRVVLDDKRCCICKQECPVVYVTKALGEYTKVVSDFSTLSGVHLNLDLWFEADIGAYFDDEDEFKRIKAICRLQCKLCETHIAAADAPPIAGAVRKGHVFRNLASLRRHIFSAHKLIMCSLCLEGRKVFIQDQKLYTKAQLDRHSSRGDSKVDGNEEERGGFTGHPMCAFCTRRFYSDIELYHHMSTEHFTCHLCQRSKPGQFEYYENYDDLESHFRNEHALCEDPECLAKKFIVFGSDGELKIHNAKEHGGSLSRAQRNAALKIPVSYQFRRPDQLSGNHRGSSSYRVNDLNTELLSESSADVPASNPENFPALAPSESSASGNAAESTRWLSVLHGSSQSSFNQCAFPPLPGVTQPQQQQVRKQHQPQQARQQLPLASLFRPRGGKVKVLNASDWRQQAGSSEIRPPESRTNGLAHPSEYPELQGGRPSSSVVADSRPSLGVADPSATSRSGTSSSAASLSGSTRVQVQLTMDEIRAATKALQEQIRTQLDGDEEQFASFKEVHSQFRKGDVNAQAYYDRVSKLGLSEILPELARLCPDQLKQQELLEVMRQSRGGKSAAANPKNGYKEKGLVKEERRIQKPVEEEPEVLSTDGYRSSRRSTSSSSSAPASSVFKAEASSERPQQLRACSKCTLLNPVESGQCSACGSAMDDDAKQQQQQQKKKKPAKVSKFLRNRIGGVEEDEEAAGFGAGASANQSSDAVTRGAWKNNGGQRLVAMRK